MFCGKCGTPIDAQTGLCPNCDGQKLPQKPKNKKKGKIIAISIISVVLCIAIVFTTLFGLGFFKKDEPVEVKTEEKEEKEKIPSIYGTISEQYAKAMLDKVNSGNGEYVNKNLLSKFKDNDKYKVYFSLVDINKDGTEELIIGGGEDKNNTKIYDIFTNDGEKPVALFPIGSIGESISLDVYDNGNIKMTNDKSPTLQQFDYYNLPEDSTKVLHQMGLTEDDGKYYKHDENGNYISTITKEEYDEVVETFESAKIKTEWTEFVPEDYVSEDEMLTDEQIASFKNLLSGMSSSLLGIYEGQNKIDTVLNSFVYSSLWGQASGTMYDYYFPGEYKDTVSDTMRQDYGYDISCEFNADKTLFILNDVFGLGVTKDYSDANCHFEGDTFYYTMVMYPKGAEGSIVDEFASYESVSDGYFLIKTNQIVTDFDGFVETYPGWYFVAKPCHHDEYGDYWAIREYGFDGERLWTNEEVSKKIPADAVEYNGHYYKLFDTSMSWNEAEEYCESVGGHLVTITTSEEQYFITSMLEGAAKNCYWTGAVKKSDQWMWITGEGFSYSNWAENEPNNDSGQENYMHLFGKEWSGGKGIKYVGDWNDVSYSGASYSNQFYDQSNFGFICEWE